MKVKVFLILSFTILIGQSGFAQQNYVYDGDTFNVWFKTDDNGEVVEVYFTSEGQWHKFELVNFEDHERRGFAFRTKDGTGRHYWIDYYTEQDHIVVTDEQDKEKWTLYRRKQ